MTTELPEPKSRKESYLAKAAGMDTTIPEKPESREEQYLEAIAEGGGGGGGGSYTAGNGIDITNDTISVDTTVVQEKLTAGDNITITNNTISATGGGGTAIDLSEDLYNWNSSTQTTTNPNSIALWLLDPGCYSLSDISVPVYTDYYNAIQQESLIWVFPAQALTGYIGIMVKNTNSSEIVYRVFDPSAGSPVTVAIFSDMNMTLLSVKSNIIQTDSNAAPTSTDYADRGQVWVYMDANDTPHLYVSAGTDWSLPTPENTWIELQSGGGGGGGTTFYLDLDSMPPNPSTPTNNQVIYSDWDLQMPITASDIRDALDNGDITLVFKDTSVADSTYKKIGKLVAADTYSEEEFEQGNTIQCQFSLWSQLLEFSAAYGNDTFTLTTHDIVLDA